MARIRSGGINNSINTSVAISNVGKSITDALHRKNYSGPVVDQEANAKANGVDKTTLLTTLANKQSTPDQIRDALVTLATDQAQATPDMTAHQFRTMVSHFMNTDVPGGIDRSVKSAVKDFLKATEGDDASDSPLGQNIEHMAATDDQVLKE